MKHLIAPTLSALLSTLLTTYGCQMSGMPPHDLVIAAAVSGSVSSFVAFGVVIWPSLKREL